ncbi:MAG TPA: family 43 glycosylhydrolase [Roseiflexaceae bacterium]|nr:family 43 glycosylhydrolase [Roseiflexaceae bacterium]
MFGIIPFLRRLAAPLGALLVALVIVLPAASDSFQATNPLVQQRADPWVYRHSDGYYYFIATAPEYDRIELRRATTIEGLRSAAATVVWRKHSSGVMGAHIWAPELHFINGRWYIYFAAGSTSDVWAIRIYVLENSSANPLQGTWTEKGQLRTGWESFALDATTFEHNGTRYLVWAQSEPGIASNSNLYIAPMSNPWTLGGAAVRIAKPDYDWEKRGFAVNEGPAVIKRNGRVFIAYSASATDANYALGLLSASDSANLLSAAAWSKSPVPVFSSSAVNSAYGPGHNSFTVSPDGTVDILVYHARSYRDITGDPLNDPNRHTRVQQLFWNRDGTPNFGVPARDGTAAFSSSVATSVSLPVNTTRSFQSFNFPDRSIRHRSGLAYIDQVSAASPAATRQEATFRIVQGLASASCYSFESTSQPGFFLRHYDYRLRLDQNANTSQFRADATFCARPGGADRSGVAFESYNFPNYYIRHKNYELRVEPFENSTVYQSDATFRVISPWQ